MPYTLFEENNLANLTNQNGGPKLQVPLYFERIDISRNKS